MVLVQLKVHPAQFTQSMLVVASEFHFCVCACPRLRLLFFFLPPWSRREGEIGAEVSDQFKASPQPALMGNDI